MKYDISRNPLIDNQGNRFWYNEDGLMHREGGPALEYSYGYKAWYINGKRHRLNGPAIVYMDKAWYIDGELIPVKSQKEFEQYLRLKAFV